MKNGELQRFYTYTMDNLLNSPRQGAVPFVRHP